MITEERPTEIVNFMTPWIGVLVLRCYYVIYMVKIRYFFKNLLIYSQAQIKQTEGTVMTYKKG